MAEKKALIKDKSGNIIYPQTQASLVIKGVQYEDLNEEIEANPTNLIEEWQAYQEQVNAIIQEYQEQVITLTQQLNEVKSVRYVVETYQNGADWYVIYSDNWCEMGGHVGTASANNYTVTFHKEFRDTNISVLVTDGVGTTTSTDTAGVGEAVMVSNLTTTSFRITIATNRQNSCWEAKGYLL